MAASRAIAAAMAATCLAIGLVACPGCGSSSRGSPTAVTTLAATTSATSTPTPTVTQSIPASTAPTTTAPIRPRAPAVARPAIVQNPIPFGPQRKREMAEYALRHYGLDTYRLTNPHVIVIHYTETPDFQSTYNTFAPDRPDPELHELPGTCAHFVIDKAGIIHQLVPVNIMCRHTVGLNWTAIGVEHVGYSDQEVLGDPSQMTASLRLVRWLRCRFHIAVRDVIGHNESLSSPYHHENVPAWRLQTHSDFNHADMQVYRRRLREAGPCPAPYATRR